MTDWTSGDGRVRLICGDSLAVMPTLAENSIDAIVTDPPYGLGFMGKDWDHGIPGVHFWIEVLRVAKPGAHLLAFGGTRTFHRLACAIEDAGWEIRDTVMWVYGQGFPKSLNVSKAIDNAAGAERALLGTYRAAVQNSNSVGGGFNASPGASERGATYATITAPATDAAKQWDGWGTALKPAWEPIILARKPLDGTVAANVQKWGTGALNIDGCRIAISEADRSMLDNMSGYGKADYEGKPGVALKGSVDGSLNKKDRGFMASCVGRWPANVIHDGSDEVLAEFVGKSSGHGHFPTHPKSTNNGIYGKFKPGEFLQRNMADNGDRSAARFFYCAKASKQDRDEGLEGMTHRRIGHNLSTNACARCGKRVKANGSGDKCECGDKRETVKLEAASRNHHPTVKPTALMRYLCRLVTPPGGLVIDLFMGSGSTGKAAIREGFRFIGIELDAAYTEIAKRRIERELAQGTLAFNTKGDRE